MEKISICIPTWNRYDLTKKCFEQVLNDDRIAEILINDDNSTDGSYQRLVDDYLFEEKVVVKLNKDRLKVHGKGWFSEIQIHEKEKGGQHRLFLR